MNASAFRSMGATNLTTAGRRQPRTSPCAQIIAEEFQRAGGDLPVQDVPIDAWPIDAALWELVPAFLVALVGEDLMVDRSGNDPELGMRNMLAANTAFSLGGVCVSDAPTVRKAGTFSSPSPAASMPNAWMIPGAIAITAFTL